VTLPPATVSVPAAPGLDSPRRGVAGARVRLACGLLGAAAGVAAFVLVARDGDVADPRATAALTLAIGWCFLGSGLIVWTREEGNPLGFLMTALGIIWLVGAAAGQLDSAIGPWIGFIALNGALAMFYFSDDGTRVTVLHVHPDSASLEYHLEVAGPLFRRFADLVTLSSIHVYGEPGVNVLKQLDEKARLLGGGAVEVAGWQSGFTRLAVQ
jgi:hypothetical protein